MEKYSSPHLRLHGNPGLKKASKSPAKSEPHRGTGQHEDMHEEEKTPEHVTMTHPGETQAHPATGVHAVHVHHTGGGKHTVHVHHDGGHVESHHGLAQHEAKQMVDEHLPAQDGEQHQEPDGDEGAGMPSGMMSSLGGE